MHCYDNVCVCVCVCVSVSVSVLICLQTARHCPDSSLEFIGIDFANCDQCPDYHSMARGSANSVIISIVKTYEIC